jgi:hypothetical protein
VQCAVSELLAAFRTGEGADLIRESARMAMQELIEPSEHIGAARYERSDTRTTERNDARGRLPATQAGDMEMEVPDCGRGRSSRSASSLGGGSTRPASIQPSKGNSASREECLRLLMEAVPANAALQSTPAAVRSPSAGARQDR